jgi:hypothetical protein
LLLRALPLGDDAIILISVSGRASRPPNSRRALATLCTHFITTKKVINIARRLAG